MGEVAKGNVQAAMDEWVRSVLEFDVLSARTFELAGAEARAELSSATRSWEGVSQTVLGTLAMLERDVISSLAGPSLDLGAVTRVFSTLAGKFDGKAGDAASALNSLGPDEIAAASISVNKRLDELDRDLRSDSVIQVIENNGKFPCSIREPALNALGRLRKAVEAMTTASGGRSS